MNTISAFCQVCGKRYTGWGMVTSYLLEGDGEPRKTCDCGGKLIVDDLYDVIIGYVRAGNKVRNRESEASRARNNGQTNRISSADFRRGREDTPVM